LTSALQAPSYPATKRLDSFITLLYERLAREVSALQDDITRDPNTVAYLVQFDVGLYPASRTKNHIARVEFELDQDQCPGCRVYSIYPGQSSYNVANYKGESRSKSFWGNLGFLIGLGVSAAYRKQEDTLQGSLVQSVYTSGFLDDTVNRRDPTKHVQRFGWNYGEAPFETYVSPGIRTTFAIITVPRSRIHNSQTGFRSLEYTFDPSVVSLAESDLKNSSTKRQGDLTTTVKSTLSVETTVVQASQETKSDQAANNDETREVPLESCFDLDVDAYWSLRDNPYYHKAHFLMPSSVVKPDDAAKVEGALTVELPGSAGMEMLPRALRAEPTRLHVTSLEYNSVYSDSTTGNPAGAKVSASQNAYTINACPPDSVPR
jgi:hypothetical protein